MNVAIPTATPTLINHWIAGAEIAPHHERRGDVFNPCTGRVTGRVAMADPEEVDAAVAAASVAFTGWSATRRTSAPG